VAQNREKYLTVRDVGITLFVSVVY
jgi:hypothetical protein